MAVEAAPPPMPTWVKAFIAIGALLLLTAVAVVLLSGGEHGPGRHFGDHDRHATPGDSSDPPPSTSTPAANTFGPRPTEAPSPGRHETASP